MDKRNTKAYARVLYEATAGVHGRELDMNLDKFVELLITKQMVKQVDRIVGDFMAYSKSEAGTVDIEITASRPLPASVLANIKKVFGDKVEATVKIDPAVLGGVVIRTGATILDGSLATQLNNLKAKLAS